MTTLIAEDAMKIKPRPNFGATLALAGIRKSDLAKASNLSAQTIQRLVSPDMYRKNDKGNVSDVSARRVANAYATITGVTPDEAFKQLFVEVEDEQTEE